MRIVSPGSECAEQRRRNPHIHDSFGFVLTQRYSRVLDRSGVPLAQGSNYWIVILGGTGTVKFHDRSHGCSSETNATRNLTALPATWTTGTTYTDCPISAYVSQ